MSIDTIAISSENIDIFDKLNLEAFKTVRSQARPEKLLIEETRLAVHELHLRKYNQATRSEGAYLKVSPCEVKIECSAKALGDQYLLGISENTFEKLIYNLNQVGEGYFQLNANKVYDNFHAQKVHNTFNFELPEGNAVKTIQAIQTNWHWSHKKNDNRFLTTATFGNKSEALTIYDKRWQLIDTRSPFLKLLKPKIDILRVEHKLEKKRQLTKIYNRVFNTGKRVISLAEVLNENNSKQVQLHTLDSIKFQDPKDNQDELFRSEVFDLFASQTLAFKTIVWETGSGLGALFELLGANVNTLDSALSIRYKGRPSSHKSRAKKDILQAYDSYMKLKTTENYESYREIAKTFLDELKLAIAV